MGSGGGDDVVSVDDNCFDGVLAVFLEVSEDRLRLRPWGRSGPELDCAWEVVGSGGGECHERESIRVDADRTGALRSRNVSDDVDGDIDFRSTAFSSLSPLSRCSCASRNEVVPLVDTDLPAPLPSELLSGDSPETRERSTAETVWRNLSRKPSSDAPPPDPSISSELGRNLPCDVSVGTDDGVDVACERSTEMEGLADEWSDGEGGGSPREALGGAFVP